MSNNLSQFTNLYELSKTLRFELKPVGGTQKMLEDTEIFEKDRIIQKKYEQIKRYFDILHRDFVSSSLENAEISDLSGYFEIYKEWKKDQKNTKKKKSLEDAEKKLRKAVSSLFDKNAERWSEKYSAFTKKKITFLF